MTTKDIPERLKDYLKHGYIQNANFNNPVMKKLIDLNYIRVVSNEDGTGVFTIDIDYLRYEDLLAAAFEKPYQEIVNELKKDNEAKELVILFDLAKKYGFSLHKEL